MWQRFTERARKAVFYAQEEAGRLGQNFVSTEHLLLGLLRDTDSVAFRMLERLKVSPTRVRKEVERLAPHDSPPFAKDMQLTPRSKKIIDIAYDEAQLLQDNYIGTEHLLIGSIREGEGLAARVLLKMGVTLEQVRAQNREMRDSALIELADQSAGPKSASTIQTKADANNFISVVSSQAADEAGIMGDPRVRHEHI